jgi:predicted DNA-binding transcriptional regulator YafY
MSEGAPLIRQWFLLRTLASSKFGVTVEELAREAEVGIQTIRRGLKVLQRAGFP